MEPREIDNNFEQLGVEEKDYGVEEEEAQGAEKEASLHDLKSGESENNDESERANMKQMYEQPHKPSFSLPLPLALSSVSRQMRFSSLSLLSRLFPFNLRPHTHA